MINKKSCLIIDSSSGIKKPQYPNVFMVPLWIVEVINENKEYSYQDLVEIDYETIVAKLAAQKNFKTSQTSLGQMIDILQKLVCSYDRIFVLPIAKGISNSFNTWQIAKQKFIQKEIIILDGLNTGKGYEVLIDELVGMLAQNKTTTEIVSYVALRAKKKLATIIVSDITQLHKGGRISNWKKTLLTFLKTNLILVFDGSVFYYDHNKSLAKAITLACWKINQVLDYQNNKIKNAFFMHSFCDQAVAIENKAMVDQALGYQTVADFLPSIILIHVGLNAFSIYVEVF